MGLCEYIEQTPLGQLDLVSKIPQWSLQGLQTALSEMERLIDFDESQFINRIVIKPFIDSDLDHLKGVYQGLEGHLSRAAEQVLDRLPEGYTDVLNVLYYPQVVEINQVGLFSGYSQIQ